VASLLSEVIIDESTNDGPASLLVDVSALCYLWCNVGGITGMASSL